MLVEDDRIIGAAVEQSLKDATYAVDWVRDLSVPEAADARIAADATDLMTRVKNLVANAIRA